MSGRTGMRAAMRLSLGFLIFIVIARAMGLIGINEARNQLANVCLAADCGLAQKDPKVLQGYKDAVFSLDKKLDESLALQAARSKPGEETKTYEALPP